MIAGLGFSLGCFFPMAMVMFQVVLLSAGAFLDIIGFQSMVIIFGMVSVGMIALFFVQMRKRNIILKEPIRTTAESS